MGIEFMTQTILISRNLAFIGCVLSLILSVYFSIKKEPARKFITISIGFAIITAILEITLKF